MKKVTLFFFIFFGSFWSFSQDGKGFVIKGSINGSEDGTSVSIRDANDNSLLASDSIKGYKFTLEGSVDEPRLFRIVVGTEEPQYLFLENSPISIVADKGALKDMQVFGSSSHKDFLAFRAVFNPLVDKLNEAVNKINPMPEGTKRDSMIQIYYSILDEIGKGVDDFITGHPSSFVSPFVLSVTSQFYDDPVLLEQRLGRLDEKIRASRGGQDLQAMIDYLKVGAIGTRAPDFTQPDTTGAPVSLSSFRGKYVLVDFWASWCRPCREENPNVVANYNRFKAKNFTVLGVSLDRPGQKGAWVNAIKQDHLTWTHVSDLQFWNNAAAQLYRVQSIPFNILVDPDGMIVGKNLRGPDLENKLCELLGCN